jgi:hypothetical protein
MQLSQSIEARRTSEEIARQSGRFQLEEMARVGRQMLENSSNDLGALSKFSDTLNSFLFDQTKAKNEQEMNLGIADILNGDLTIREDAYQQFNEAREELAAQATAEAAVSDVIAERGSPIIAEEHRTTSPAMKGWRGYGRAIGLAMKAASVLQPAMQEFMASGEETIPVPNDDGTIRYIAPRDAKTGAEVNAALAVAQQMFIKTAGLSNINPVILAERVAPQMLQVKSAIVSNRMAEVRKEAQEEAIQAATSRLGANLLILDAEDEFGIQQAWQETTKELRINGRMSSKDANETVARFLIGNLRATGSQELLNAFARTPLIETQPNGPTLGDQFRELFEDASRSIQSFDEQQRARAEKEIDDAVDDLVSAHNLILSTPGATREQISESFNATTEQLRSLAAAGSTRAVNQLLELEKRGQNYNPLMAGMLQQDIAAGVEHSEGSLNRLAVEGVITYEEAARLAKGLPTSASMEKVEGFSSSINRQVRGQLEFILAENGITSTDGSSVGEMHAGQMADEIKASLQQMLITNPDMSNAEIRDFILKESQALARDPRFRPQFDSAGNLKVPNLEPNSRVLSFRNPTTNQMVRDFSQAPAAVVQSTRANTVRDYLINPQELTQNAQAFIQGGQPTPRVRALMSVTGKDWQTFLRDQHQVRGLSFTDMSQAQAAQAAQQRRALAPAAAALLVNPNATPQQRVNAWNDINAARLRQQRSAEQRQLGGTTGPIDFNAAYDALVGKESGGDPSVLNRSGSGATGLGQVMPENIGPWTERWLGRRMTQEEFRRNPEAQRRVVSQQFQSNINDQLAAGHAPEMALRRAAAIWYSGRAELHNDTRPQSWNGNPYPSIKEYVDDIVNRYNTNRGRVF